MWDSAKHKGPSVCLQQHKVAFAQAYSCPERPFSSEAHEIHLGLSEKSPLVAFPLHLSTPQTESLWQLNGLQGVSGDWT